MPAPRQQSQWQWYTCTLKFRTQDIIIKLSSGWGAVSCLHQHQKVCVVLRHICHSLKPPHNVESISFIALARRLKAWFWWDLCGVVLSASQGVVSSCCCRIVRGVEKAKKGLGWAVQGVLLCWHKGEVTWGVFWSIGSVTQNVYV